MKLKISISITVDKSSLDWFGKPAIKNAIKAVVKDKLANLPPAYTIENTKVEEVKA